MTDLGPDPPAPPADDVAAVDCADATSPGALTEAAPPAASADSGGSGWGWSATSALSGWGWSTLTAAATTASTLTRKLEDIVMIPGHVEPEAETSAEEPPVDGKGPAGFWNTEEIRFLTTIATGTVAATAKLADRGLEALGSGIETLGSGLTTVTESMTQALPLGAAVDVQEKSDEPVVVEEAKDSAPTLAGLAAASEARLAALDAAARAAAAALGAGLADEAQAEPPTAAEEAQCTALPFFEALSLIESSSKAICMRLEGSADAATVLQEIPSASAAAASELLALATAHLARVAAALDAGAPLDGLLPGSDAPPPDSFGPAALARLRVFALVTLAVLGRLCGGYSALATQLVTVLKKRAKADKTREGEELAARARAVKGEVYVLQGSTTAALLAPLEQVLTVLRAAALCPASPAASSSPAPNDPAPATPDP